jgi:hypothetical protein
MKVAVRPFDHSEELQRGVDRLRKLVYPHLPESTDVAWHASIWRWLESHPLGNEMQRWVLVTEEEEVVGHLAATPQYYRIGGERVVAYTPADYQVLPKYGFQALLLMRKFFRSTENCVAVDMLPSVIAVETRLGAEEAGGMQYAAKLLNVSRLPSPRLPSPVRRLLNIREQPEESAPVYEDPADPAIGIDDVHGHVLPPPKRPRAPIPAPVKGLLNGGLQVVDEALSRGFGDRSRVEVLEGFDESFDVLFEKIVAQVPCVPEKDSAFLRWRYGPGSPQTPVTILGVREGEDLLGYAVLGVTVENLEGFRDAYILDLVALPGHHDVTRVLLGEAVRFFRKAGVPLVRYRYLESPTSPQSGALLRFGFFPRKGRRNWLLVKFADPGRHKVARHITNWSYSIGDGEATFWVKLS